MNLFQNGLLFSLPVHTYLLICETGYWSIFIYVYMTGCAKCHVYFSTFVFANESWFFLWPSVVVHEHWPVSQRMIVEMGSTRGASTLSRYFWPVRLPPRTYKSNLQSKEKQPQTVTPPSPKAVVPKMWLSWNEVFRWRHDRW